MPLGNHQTNVKAVITAEDKTAGVMRGFGDKVGAMSSAIATGMKVAATAMAAAGAAAATFALKSAADFEQTRIGLENMLGSADAARDMLSKVSKFAAETPFQFPELAEATRQLIAFGFSGDEAYDTMKQLGDVSAAIGAPINDLAYLMGTLKAQGRAFTIDIRQFAQRGIPIYEYLAKVLHTDTKALDGLIESGKVGFPEVQKAFEMMTAEGGKFHGTMEKQSRSLSGLFSTLQDNLSQVGRELIGINQQGDIKEGSVFDKLRISLMWLNDNLPAIIASVKATMTDFGRSVLAVGKSVGDYLLPKLQGLFESIQKNLLPVLRDLWHGVIEPMLPVLGTLLVVAIGAVVDAMKIMIDMVGWLHRELENGNPFIWALVGALGALAAALALQAAFTAVTTGLTVLTTVTIPLASAAFAGLAGLIASPIIMPALIIGAALASISAVANSFVDLINQINDNEAKAKADAADAEMLRKISSDYKAGKISKETKDKLVKIYARAGGGSVTPGNVYAVGDNPDGSWNKTTELFVPNTSGSIVSAKNAQGGGGGTPANINFNVTVGMYNGSEIEKRRLAKSIFDAAREYANANGTTPAAMLGIQP